jgi:pimeloyl-ACP methyl ester carboxylesterase
MSRIRRGFADLTDRQVHYRIAGDGKPSLVMLHGSPGSSRQLAGLIEGLAAGRTVLAPDTPGYGDSAMLPGTGREHPPTIADFSAATLALFDSLGLEQVDLYGSHTGGAIAIDLASRAPGRVRRLVVDGVGHFSDQEMADHLSHYALELTPDRSGAYLTAAFAWVKDLFLFWPWYKPDATHRRDAGVPDPAVLHALLVELLKNIDTYHLGYRAAFAYPSLARLQLVPHETLLMAQDGDPLAPHTQAAADLLPHMRHAQVARADAAALLDEFLS